jgi:pyruvate dehydrogenase E2 component (dihydrolipoamide acetyltransferase)
MTRKVVMPVLGETMEEGTIVQWKKQVGEWVQKGDVLLSVESDKATLDVEAFFSGHVRKILYAEQAVVKVGEAIALITDTLEEPLED